MTELANYIRTIPDFPSPGVQFKDVSTLLQDPVVLRQSISEMMALVHDKIDIVVGIESRGFIFGSILADRLGAGFVPVRKKGKLPGKTISESYSLEYGHSTLELHVDAIEKGQTILIVDDLLATGGTCRAAVNLVEKLGGNIHKILFLIELEFLKGREKINQYDIEALIKY